MAITAFQSTKIGSIEIRFYTNISIFPFVNILCGRGLSVIFSPEVFDIWDHNLDTVMKKVKSMINAWSKRKLTLIGRVTVIKSLMLSKFAYLFLALPNQPGDLLRKLERMFFKFLWNKGPD